MPLPKIVLPQYTTSLPSDGRSITYRPYTVKEEKILLTAQESNDKKQVFNAMIQILNNCIEDLDVNDIPFFDVEYMLMKIRAVSVDDLIEFQITDPDTEEKIKLELNLERDLKFVKPDNVENKISLDEQSTLVLKYPSMRQFEKFQTTEELKSEDLYDALISCLDCLVHGEEVYKFSDMSKSEIDEFFDEQQNSVLVKIKDFFENRPKVQYALDYTLSDGTPKTFVIEGTESFFISR